MPLVAALCVPLTAVYSLSARMPDQDYSYLAALLLMSTTTSGALLLTRGLARSLGPGAFTRT